MVTDGFYEWKKLDDKGKVKQPYAIATADDGPMVMAGLWALWKDTKSGDEIASCTIQSRSLISPGYLPVAHGHWN